MQQTQDVPVLLLVFNRPTKTRRMISVLREAKPSELFVAADGPRPGRADDLTQCSETRRALDDIDWPCSVQRLFQDDNLGCKRGPEAAITWFFSQVSAGIILEDDCIPQPEFFPFCAELLDRYQDDERVMMISGSNLLGARQGEVPSYQFSRTAPAWGWASWRRAWRRYDPDMSAWPSSATREALRSRLSAAEFRVLARRFDQVHSGELDAWDFAWLFAILQANGVTAISACNIISNIGFDAEATHTTNPWSPDACIPTGAVRFPLSHPPHIEPSYRHEEMLFRRRFSFSRRLMGKLPYSAELRIRESVHKVALRASRVGGPQGEQQRPGGLVDRGGTEAV
jgi:hypothetical protein